MSALLLLWIALESMALLCLAGALLCKRRNPKVAAYRLALIDEIATACQADAFLGRDWEWRWEAFSAVEYGRMVWQFWRPIDSFYADRTFTTPGAVCPTATIANAS